MTLSPDLAACAALVEKGDPDRFAATMAAPPGARSRLWPLYAYNLEIARAPWASKDPILAEMRLQWWIDLWEGVASGKAAPRHEVASPLADLQLSPSVLAEMAAARIHEASGEAFPDAGALIHHLDATAGNLMWLAAQALGAGQGAEGPVRDFAFGAGLAAWFQAVPTLRARGRAPLPDDDPGAVRALALHGLQRLRAARAARSVVPSAAGPALWPGYAATHILNCVARDPHAIDAPDLGRTPLGRALALGWRSLTGRW